jgi:hypothetical protein
MKKRLWVFILSWIEHTYQKEKTKRSSAIVDCCIFLKEEL